MRRAILLFNVAALLLSTTAINAQKEKNKNKEDWKDRPKIEGSGNMVTKTVNIQSFDQLDVTGVFNLKLSQGDKEELKIEADDNLQRLFEVKNEGSKLIVSMAKDSNFNSKKTLKVYITFKKLKTMNLKTVGNITSEQNLSFDNVDIDTKSVGSVDLKLTAQSINLDNKSVGDVTLNGKADNAIIRNKSVGSLMAGDFVVQTMDIDNHGVGSAQVNATKTIKVKDSFLGKVTNKGAAPIRRMNKVVI